jgi:hypothetical protein
VIVVESRLPGYGWAVDGVLQGVDIFSVLVGILSVLVGIAFIVAAAPLSRRARVAHRGYQYFGGFLLLSGVTSFHFLPRLADIALSGAAFVLAVLAVPQMFRRDTT